MRASLLTFSIVILVVGSCIAPIAAQGVTAGFTVQVRFFYPFCLLYNLRVTIRDQTGRLLATATSPDGSMIIIPITTETQTYSLTASASGYASGFLTNWETNPHFWAVTGTSTIPVQMIGGNYWMTIVLS